MSAWVVAYFAAYVSFVLWSVIHDVRSKEDPLWLGAAEIVGDACLVLAALSFWSASVRESTGHLMLVFAAGLAVLVGQVARSLYQEVLSDQELSLPGKVFVGGIGAGLVILISAPLIYWGFKATVLGVSHGT